MKTGPFSMLMKVAVLGIVAALTLATASTALAGSSLTLLQQELEKITHLHEARTEILSHDPSVALNEERRDT